MSLHEVSFQPSSPVSPQSLSELIACEEGPSPATRQFSYSRAAYDAAIENGLLPEELDEVLAGRRVTDAFPIEDREALAGYVSRAVAEIMVAYICRSIVP